MSILREDGGQLFSVLGMQHGSEGKGSESTYLAFIMSMGVRTGASNAGHTGYWNGMKFVMHQLPCTWVNPVAQLVVGIGALISLPVLLQEVEFIERHIPGVRQRLFIDKNAHVITPEHIRREKETSLAKRIGSTSATAGLGIGTAGAAKVLREESCLRADQVPELKPYCVDTVDLINSALDAGQFVFLEGTQGFGLSLDHGSFPYVTSRDTTATALAASVGVAPHAFQCNVYGIVRTYQIRVPGDSGPFEDDSQEISWEEVTRRAGSPVPIVEYTSVTNSMRRVAPLSEKGLRRACQVNRPTEIALNFVDYIDWSVHGKTEETELTSSVEAFKERVESIAGVPVTLVGTGPQTIIDYDEYRRRMRRKLA